MNDLWPYPVPNRLRVYNSGKPWHNPLHVSLWSLAEMLKAINIKAFDDLLDGLRRAVADLDRQIDQFGPSDPIYPDGEHLLPPCVRLLERAKTLCGKQGFDLEMPSARISRAEDAIENDRLTVGELYRQLLTLLESIEDALHRTRFLHLPANKEPYFDRDCLFGQQVEERFHVASRDIRDAGSCFAVGLHLACVFHLMRVLEYGLRALAADLGITPRPIASWGDILRGIEEEIAQPTNNQSAATSEKQELKRFYNEAASQFRLFKNSWRNYTMHAWAYCGEEEAEHVMRGVGHFMRHIATRLSYPTGS